MSLTAAAMATLASSPVAASAMKAGSARIAQSPTAHWAVPVEVCVSMASAFVTVNTVEMTVRSFGAQQTAVPEGSVWMGNVSVRSPTQAMTAGSCAVLGTVQGRVNAPMVPACAKRAMLVRTAASDDV